MDFTPDPLLEGLRAEFRDWLAANRPTRRDPPPPERALDPEWIGHLKDWQGRLARERWLAVHWPEDCGGRGLGLGAHLVVTEELTRADAPPLINGPAMSIFGPTLLLHGTPDQRRRYLPKLLSAEEVWCLGFSEPSAGSDLASLRTRAECQDESFWRLSGQKVWTSYAEAADLGFFLVRTDPEAPPHKGISCVIIDMRAPGVSVRPLKQITGEREFAEVFLDGALARREDFVGELNRGWEVILAALGHERGTLLVVDGIRMEGSFTALVRLAREIGVARESVWRDRIAAAWIDVRLVRLLSMRLLGELERGAPSPATSVLKLVSSESSQRLADLALAVERDYAQLYRESPRVRDGGRRQHAWLMSRAATIASGTSEVQRNIIAERLLGLPKGH
jgi:alkylation response protein AidB-like acyl-CoA dehydrogenase